MAIDTARIEALVTARQQLPPPGVRRALRLEAGLALADVAQAIGYTRQAVSNWENGVAQPRGENLRRYVELLAYLRGRLGGGASSP